MLIASLCLLANTEQQMKVTFDNYYGQTVELFWDNNKKGEFQQEMVANARATVNTFLGHRFYFVEKGSDIVIHETIVTKGINWVKLYPLDAMKAEKSKWMHEYFKRTGRMWKNYYPRGPITHYYHKAKQGEIIHVETDRTQYHICRDGELTAADIATLNGAENHNYYSINAVIAYIFMCCIAVLAVMKTQLQRFINSDRTTMVMVAVFIIGLVSAVCVSVMLIKDEYWSKYPSKEIENELFYIGRINGTTYCRPKIVNDKNVTLDIINICAHGPHAFRIFNFLSDDEMEHIKNFGQSMGLKRSTVSEEETKTDERTSQTVWIQRDQSFIIDNVIRRIADAVRIPQDKLFINASAESLQLVHYFGDEWYRKHYDFETDKPHSRYVTFLMYLNDVTEGGNTSFPAADEKCKGEKGYFATQPIKGSAVFFYNLLPDGNVDTKTMHQGDPPTNGSEKWMTNLWIWDEIFMR